MDFNQLLDAHTLYGTTKEDILKREGFEKILENVVIAPWWDHTLFENKATSIEKVGSKTYNIYGKDFAFSFIEMKNVGAPAIVDEVLSLGVSPCKKLIFIGSAGALVNDIKIGELAIPKFSYNGVGACRFLNQDLKDDFEEKIYPNKEFSEKLIKVMKGKGQKFHEVKNYSVDCVFAQFPHIDHFIDLEAQTIEMETSCLFKCASVANIAASALFCISDNTLKNKSLYSGRSAEDKANKLKTRTEIIPEIIIDLFKNNI